MVYPFLYIRIAVAYCLIVTILFVEHVTGKRQTGRPRYVIVIIVPEGRCHITEHSVGSLRVTDVAHPACVHKVIIKEIALAQTAHSAVAKPRLPFVALRAVGRETMVVCLYAPPGIAVYLVQRIVT